MKQIVLSLGSNVGDRKKNIKTSADIIEKSFGVKLTKSPVYDTPPLYYEFQDNFFNCCVCFKAALSVEDVYKKTIAIEKEMGRKREIPQGPRIIDLDILFVGDEVVADDKLTIPHSGIHLRRFVLLPLCDIVPDFFHPVLGQTIEELLEECPDRSEIRQVKDFWKDQK